MEPKEKMGYTRHEDIPEENVKKEAETDYTIEGQIKSTAEVDFSEVKLAVHAFVGGVEVAHAPVDQQGKYKLTFKYKDQPPATELRVIPAELPHHWSEIIALSETFSSSRYVPKKQSDPVYHAVFDMHVPPDYLLLPKVISKEYHIYGTVYARGIAFPHLEESPSPEVPILLPPTYNLKVIPGAKLEFYEVSGRREVKLEETTTGKDGSYNFNFTFTYFRDNGYYRGDYPRHWLFEDYKPDIRVKIYQLVSDSYKQIYESEVDWDIVKDFHRNYYVPAKDTFPIPDHGGKPRKGFRYNRINNLLIDENHISDDGYASVPPPGEYLLPEMHHRPFCGILHIHGFFAGSNVKWYKVQVKEYGAKEEDKQNVGDRLTHYYWIDDNTIGSKDIWPNSAGAYENIDNDTSIEWIFPDLKATWNSASVDDGRYELRIVSCTKDGEELDPYPIDLQIDNNPPDADIEALGETNKCGHLELDTKRHIKFWVKAYDRKGHLLRYRITGTRGKVPQSAGDEILHERGERNLWTGTPAEGKEENFEVNSLRGDLIGCSPLAYNFKLTVVGSATDCLRTFGQGVTRETNLVVSEP